MTGDLKSILAFVMGASAMSPDGGYGGIDMCITCNKISLIEAVKLLDLNDDYGINFCIGSEGAMNDVYMCVKNMRKYLDMRLVTVRKIGLFHYKCSPDVSLEFVVSPEDLMYIKTVIRNLMN